MLPTDEAILEEVKSEIFPTCLSAFEQCANDFKCAGSILRSYYNAFSKVMLSPLQTNLDRKKFARDRITSKTLARMHNFSNSFQFFLTHLQDCDGDQRITCDDYAMMHKNGGYNCGNSLQNTLYWKQYMACKNNIANTEGINI